MSNFDKTFAKARKLGKKTFVYNGKTYTTDLKTETKNNNSSNSKNKSRLLKRLRLNNKGIFSEFLPTMVSNKSLQRETSNNSIFNMGRRAVLQVQNAALKSRQLTSNKTNNSVIGTFWNNIKNTSNQNLNRNTRQNNNSNTSFLSIFNAPFDNVYSQIGSENLQNESNYKKTSTHIPANKKYRKGALCAMFRNDALRFRFGIDDIYGNAWDTANQNVEKVKSGFDGLPKPTDTSDKGLLNFSKTAAAKFAKDFSSDSLDKSKVYIVNTMYTNSKARPTAFLEGAKGEYNTHTGYAAFENGQWTFHSEIDGKEYMTPLNDIIGANSNLAVTSIYKPRKQKYGGLIKRKYF